MQFWLTILVAILGVLGTMFGTIIGAILAISGGFAEKIYERRKERESLRAALRAEIQAILAIVEERKFIADLSKFIEAIKGGATNFFEIRIAKDYDMVFRSNCGKLGLLPPETAAETVRFYFMVSSVREDLVLLQNASESANLRTSYGLDTPHGNLAFHEQMLRFSIETVTLGNHLIQELA